MVASTALLLFVIGLCNFFKFSIKWDKFVCGISSLALFAIVVRFADKMLDVKEHSFSFLWNSSPSGDIKFDIISNAYNCELFFVFLVMGLLAVCANYCFRFEEKRCHYNALVFLNLTALLLMITSNNFVQLLSALFLIDVFAVALADNPNACRRFIMVNLLSDMLIFMILALINARVDSLDIRQIINYKNMGYHLDFIAIIGFSAILMKLGFFPFQTNLLALKNIRMHRLQSILCLFSPISALILLLKFNTLWLSSEYFLLIFDVACPLSIAWCAFRASLDDDIKAKIINWQIMFYALMLELLRFHGFVWDWHISDLMLANYVWLCGVYLLYYHSARKKRISEIMKIRYERVVGICLSVVMIFLAILPQINILEMLYNNRNRYYIWLYATLFMLSFCGVLHQILFTEKAKNISLRKIKVNPLHPLFLLLIGVILVLLLVQLNWESLIFWSMTGIFVALTLSGISSGFSKYYASEPIQKVDWLQNLYDNVFMEMLQNFGRLLWLLIDWKLAEKFITGTVLTFWQAGLHFFKNIQQNYMRRTLFVLLVLSTVIWLSPYMKEVLK